VAHACLAQLFFCTLVAIATVTSREWIAAEPPAEDISGLRGAAAVATGAVFVQLLLGAVMRHIGAGLAIPDFPTSFGRWVPPLDRMPVAVHFAHRLGAIVVTVLIARVAIAAWRASERRFRRPALVLLALVAFQIGLGAATVLTGKAVTPTTFHVAVGAAVLGSCWWLALRSTRILRRRSSATASAAAFREPLAS
jgi:cytochrome c oxidase assembly protein subunit 15